MTLLDFMAAAPSTDDKGQPIYYHIGSKESFIMVVTTDEFMEHAREWDKRIKDIFYQRAENHFKKATVKLHTYTTYEDENITQFYALTKELNARDERYNQAMKSFPRALEKLYNFVPLITREVVDNYNRISGGCVVEITGDESGPFWDRQEYEREIKKWHSGKAKDEKDN